jgi:pimeloyl-ACP methyl ester carboxylesterase
MRDRTATTARLAGLLVVAALVVGGRAGCQPARPVARDKPVLLIHGYNLGGGTDCAATFDRTISQLRGAGFTGPFVKVGFYTGDTGCDMSLRSWGTFDNGSSWKEIAKAFSKYVYATYTSKGVAVDVVGYSMGGNIARGAVYGASIGEAGFSAPIRVEDAVTLGAPHAGAAWYTYGCLWGMCSSLKPSAGEIKWLLRNGDPQGLGGTEWTVVGSTDDAVVPALSATYMALVPNRKVTYSDVPHTGGGNYMGRTDVIDRAAQALAAPNS